MWEIMSTKFFTNTNERNLFDKFKGIIENMKDLYAFHAVVVIFVLPVILHTTLLKDIKK
jgi:hypothetical protein